MTTGSTALTATIDKEFLLGVLKEVADAVNDPDLPNKDDTQLLSVVSSVLAAVTPPKLGDVLSERLVSITKESPKGFATIANPAVKLLKRRPNGDEDAEASHFRIMLKESEAYPSELLGDLILDANPYFPFTDDILSEGQIQDAKGTARRGGPFRDFSSFGAWDKTHPVFTRIPHPADTITGFDRSWYMVTRRTPASLPNPITPPADRDRARNIVKTVEIVYGSQDPDADGQIGIDTGEVWPVTHPLAGKPKKKPAHIFVMYAGGNGT
jgi:hypothetical protein